MDPTRELVDAAQVGTAVAVLSAVAAVGGAILLVMSRRQRSGGLLKAALLLLATALLFPMWLIYNRIEDHFGLDSVAALLINLVLFCVVGVAVGIAMRRFWPVGEDELNRQDAKSAKLEGS
jgi:hypothetical protein